jgi:hypothetical protein
VFLPFSTDKQLLVLDNKYKCVLRIFFYSDSEGQETGAIAPAPENARKNIWSIVPVKIFKK